MHTTVEVMPGVGIEVEMTVADEQPDPDVLVVDVTAGRLVGIGDDE